VANIGILAYGSLIQDPGTEIKPLIIRHISTQTPFAVEYARFSDTRGGAPTLVLHCSGNPVTAEIFVLKNDVSLEIAKDLLWRRETRNEGTGKRYPAGNSANSIAIEHLTNFQGLDHIIYTDFHPGGKIAKPDPAFLARKAIISVRKADIGKDGISYLIKAIESGIITPLTDQYVASILKVTAAASLRQALGWLQAKKISHLAKSSLRINSKLPASAQGYVAHPQDNLIPGVLLEQFDSDMRKGAGQELKKKFCAVHSSSALAVNTFAPFKDMPEKLILLGKSGFDAPSFEHELPSGLKGTPPTPDVFLRCGDEAVAIEAKFLEYFTPKKAQFSHSYRRSALPWAEDCWWRTMEAAKRVGKSQLDIAQLVKHYFGLSHLLKRGDPSGWKPAQATLLYLFWEPATWEKLEICHQHRREVEELASLVSASKISFQWLTYDQLWEQWATIHALAQHVANLRARYRIRL